MEIPGRRITSDTEIRSKIVHMNSMNGTKQPQRKRNGDNIETAFEYAYFVGALNKWRRKRANHL